MWIANNDLRPVRPMVYMDQLPWHELAKSPELKLVCETPFLREVEKTLRETLYRWNHFPCDMVVENRIDIPYSVHNLDYGVHVVEDVLRTEEANEIVSHKYKDQIQSYEELNSLKYDEIWVDRKLDQEHMELCQDIFGDILPVRLSGVQIHSGVWDRIAQMHPAENILWDLADRPEFIEDTVKKMVDISMNTVDQCGALGILDPHMSYIHCTGAYTEDLPKDGLADGKITSKNVWSLGMAQLFSTVSPTMHQELEIDLVKPLYERFALMYYVCCEPLEQKIDIIRKIKNVRKISISPWAKPEVAAPRMGKDYVMSLKSNPAFLAMDFDEKDIRKQIEQAKTACRESGTPLEIILKDVSTVSHHGEYLEQWEKLVMKLVQM